MLNERFRSSEFVEKASLDENKFNYYYKDDVIIYLLNQKLLNT